MHQKAFEKYTDRAVDLLTEWRLACVKARNLASLDISSALDSFQMKMFRDQDTPINILHRTKSSDSEWQKQHKVNVQMLTEANNLLIQLAKDMDITRDNIK